MQILVIGYGNPSRMDDGVGHYVVNRLNEALGLPVIDLLGEPSRVGADVAQCGERTIRVVWLQQLDVGLAEDFAAVDRVLLIDAHVDGPELVEVEVSGGHHIGVTSHVATPDTLVELAENAYGHRPRATRYSIRGDQFDFAATLTPRVQALADSLATRLLQELTGA